MIKIRQATVADCEAILEIEKAVFGEETEETLERAIKSPTFKYFVAVDEDAIVGYGAVNIMLGEAEILTIAVPEENRRNGIASLVLEKMIERAKKDKAEKLFLEVDIKNKPAIELYRKFKFQEIALRENYYKRKDGNYSDAKIMFLNLE
ncbi:MAG: ribosomal protein S18-alanine N-acetyltransferase [Clostridia bacterium]|nr:ribosomal protein S18-alanine N-acetyltransferase [Clostridia bacterium]